MSFNSRKSQAAKILACYGITSNDLTKGGEGSHGGHVIGHTKTGKPIYEDHNHLSHTSFTREENLDASHIHQHSYLFASKAAAQHPEAKKYLGNPIGETTSGKLIYPLSSHPAHHKYTEQDHKDASTALQHLATTNTVLGGTHLNEANKHLELSAKKVKDLTKSEETDLEKGGEGSKGGHIIGHTKTGKAIYENADHSSHKNFSIEDHRDAQDIHESENDKHSDEIRKHLADPNWFKKDNDSEKAKSKEISKKIDEHNMHARKHQKEYENHQKAINKLDGSDDSE